jgi:hypothetical protein
MDRIIEDRFKGMDKGSGDTAEFHEIALFSLLKHDFHSYHHTSTQIALWSKKQREEKVLEPRYTRMLCRDECKLRQNADAT